MSHKSKVQWEAPEPDTAVSEPPIKLLKVKPMQPHQVWVLSDFVLGVKTHWVNGRTQPCLGMVNGCEGCKVGLSIRKKGYLCVWGGAAGSVSLLEITPTAFDFEPKLYYSSGLRGMLLRAKRMGNDPKSALRIEMSDTAHCPHELPPSCDVQEVLCRIWFGKNYSKRSAKLESENVT